MRTGSLLSGEGKRVFLIYSFRDTTGLSFILIYIFLVSSSCLLQNRSLVIPGIGSLDRISPYRHIDLLCIQLTFDDIGKGYCIKRVVVFVPGFKMWLYA